MTNNLNEPFEKLCDTKKKEYRERLVNADMDRRIFPNQISMMIVLRER